MKDKDISELGREIGDKINKFVDSEEIKELQENIRITVEGAMQGVGRSVKEAADYMNKNVEIHWSDAGQKPQEDKKKTVLKKQKRQLPIVKRPRGSVSGVLMIIGGSCGCLLAGIASAGQALYAFVQSGGIIASAGLGISTGMAVCFVGMLAAGISLRRRAKRFKKYVRAFGPRDFYSIKGLAEIVKKKEKYVIRDIKKMIKRGWFKEGHLDEQETCFMLTNESYRMYLDAQAELARRKQEEDRLARERELLEQDPEKKHLRTVIEEGKEYIRRIREVNDDIPGEDISQKLYRLEKICTRIFEYVEGNPEKLPDIRKFMSYYLPTTLKLVETYHEFSIQPVQGENIKTARTEVEETLDDINMAFEKMFDKLFEEDALDISTDISVLSAMLAQEGLLEDEFKV